MKNFLRPLKLACLAAASMLIVSCGGSADYRSILPADSFMTVSVNPASLMQKCEAGDLDQHPLYVRIKAELDKDQNLSAEEKEYLLALLKNPGESGIDVKKDFFFFAAMEGTVDAPVMRGGLLLPIGDKAKFDALLARINEKSGVAPETKGGVSVVDLGKEGDAGVLCAYNDIAFMVYFVQNGVDDLAGDVRKLFAQQSGESLMGDKAVAEQLARKNDINMVLSYGEILPMMNNPMLSSMPMMDALKGMTMVGSVNFEKGRIVTEAAVSYKDKESEAKMMDFYAYVKPQTGALLRYVPAASIGAMSLGLNGEKLYSMLSAMPGYGMLMANPMVKQVMEPFDGDFLLSFSGMGIDGKYPVASMLAQVKDPAVLQTIVTNLAGMPVQQTAEGEYTLNMGGVTILFDAADCRTLSVAQWGELRRRSLSMLFQDLRLFGELTVAENLALKNELTHFLTPDRIERLLEAAGIAGKRDTPAGKLSFGQQQRVAFIRCLCQPFDFILLDEPVSHLDAANGEVLSALLLEGAQAQGAGVIVTSVGSRLRLPYHKIFTL